MPVDLQILIILLHPRLIIPTPRDVVPDEVPLTDDTRVSISGQSGSGREGGQGLAERTDGSGEHDEGCRFPEMGWVLRQRCGGGVRPGSQTLNVL